MEISPPVTSVLVAGCDINASSSVVVVFVSRGCVCHSVGWSALVGSFIKEYIVVEKDQTVFVIAFSFSSSPRTES